MSSRKLPKVTRSTMDEVRGEAANGPPSDAAVPARTGEDLHRPAAGGGAPLEAPSPASSPVGAADPSQAAGERAEVTVWATAPRDVERELQHARAQVIIERHATYSALGSFLPFAAIDAITVGVLVFSLVKSLARHYQVPFEDDRLKALTSAVAGGLFAPAAGSIATHLVSAFIPWAPLVGAAASSASAAVFVKCVGKVFVQHFEEGGTLADVGVVGMRGAVRGLMVKG